MRSGMIPKHRSSPDQNCCAYLLSVAVSSSARRAFLFPDDDRPVVAELAVARGDLDEAAELLLGVRRLVPVDDELPEDGPAA